MSDNDDEFRTPEERRADEEQERQVLEIALLFRDLDDHQAALERVAFEDPLGATWFGDDDGWVDSRLSGRPRK
ncbi:MAG TPA: hypothetical protein VGG53_00030 [Mycobacterium sp.]|jgi:hypothetical protein|uniref:hypothetical protein n=1 Tax=Mycobacterium sp. TaxID=1785 RepID=UPI002F3FDF2A